MWGGGVLTFIWKPEINEQDCPVWQIVLSQEKPGKQTRNRFSFSVYILLSRPDNGVFLVNVVRLSPPSLQRMVEGPAECAG